MPTPNEVYNSNSVPAGSSFVNVYRNQAHPVLLGVYLFESLNPTPSAVVTDRPHVDGGDNGFKVVNGKKEGGAVFQRAAEATPSLKNGDFFKISTVEVDAAGAGVAEYYVITSPSQDIEVGYRKQSATVRQDKFPSEAVQAILEYAA